MPSMPSKFVDIAGEPIEIGDWLAYPWQSGRAEIRFAIVVGKTPRSGKLTCRVMYKGRFVHPGIYTQGRSHYEERYVVDGGDRILETPSLCWKISRGQLPAKLLEVVDELVDPASLVPPSESIESL